MRRNKEHEKDLELAHKIFDGRNLMTELRWQRRNLDTGYLSVMQVLFNKWIFDECLKRLEKQEKITDQIKTIRWLMEDNESMTAKLERIVELVNDFDGSTPSMIKQFSEIQKVLEKE